MTANPKPRLLLIGWDAADWKTIQPLLQAGQMPNLARLMAGGIHGNLATIYPVLSPMLWTSIATGKRAYKHGIHGFIEPFADGSGVRPISLLSRKTKAVWNILNQTGHRSIVVGWWPSHPAEPFNGVMVSNHFHQPAGKPGSMPPLSPGTVHPASLASSLAELRVNPMELSGEFLRFFVPEYEKVDQEKDKRLHALGKIIAETMSVHAAATELLATQPWDFAALYYSAIDHFGHAFMRYHPPRLPWVPEEDFAIYKDVIANAYRYHDAMLGALLEFADENTTVILMSDHGFHPDHLRPGYIPAEPAGPAVEHRHFGIVCLNGPALRANERLFGAGLLDICPTILTLFGLPPGKDMDGKVLLNAFRTPPAIEPIESWDAVPGDAGTHSAEARMDPAASAEAFKQLVALGYVAPPADNAQQTVDECIRELKYNLARSYRDGNRCAEAAVLAEELWNRWPKEHRFGLLLVETLGPLDQLARRKAAIEELSLRITKYQEEAKIVLAKKARGEQSASEGQKAQSKDPNDREERRAHFELRQLRELAQGRPLLLEWLNVTQALLEKKPAEARRWLEKLVTAEDASHVLNQRVAGALAQLGELEPARALLEDALKFDPENALVHAQLAGIHFEASEFEKTITAATESLSLLYFQPGIHALLGQALLETGRFEQAEKELLVAVSQSPRNLVAHDLLARLYRDHLNRPADAFAHEGRARSIRNELALRQSQTITVADEVTSLHSPPPPLSFASKSDEDGSHITPTPPPFPPSVAPDHIITVVSGLPRSGTSMMMQLLVAAGREALTDSKRAPDEDNPLGYFEYEKVLALPKDSGWLPDARGKVVKIVAQLLPFLPATERYNVILMERHLSEVIASQKAMLARHGQAGAKLEDQRLMETYASQLQRIRNQLARRPECRLLTVDYGSLLAEPRAGIEQLAAFLSGSFDKAAALSSIRPQLRRQKL